MRPNDWRHASRLGGLTHSTPTARKMTEKEKLIRDIRTVGETINRDWADLTSSLSLSHDERTALRAHVEKCVQDLKGLIARLDELTLKSN
jgi:hypothetical protein